MAGIAIKIQGADYSERGLGKVHIKGSAILITGITISGPNVVTNSGQFSSVLAPSNTTQTEVVWSIVAGDEYAAIDNTGLVTALNGANSSSVTIKCASKDNPTIYATKIVRVTYQEQTGLVSDGLINNFDAYRAKTTQLLDPVSNKAVTFNGSVGENCIVVGENDKAYDSNNQGTEMALLNGLSTWTLEYVIEATGWAASNSERTLYHDVTSASGQGRMQISLGKIGSNRNGAVFVRYNNAWQPFLFNQDTLNSIDWSKPHVIQITREAAASGMSYKLYIDGSLLGSASGIAASNIATFAGAVNIMPTTGARKLFALRAYNKALSASEAAQNYQYNVERYNI